MESKVVEASWEDVIVWKEDSITWINIALEGVIWIGIGIVVKVDKASIVFPPTGGLLSLRVRRIVSETDSLKPSFIILAFLA